MKIQKHLYTQTIKYIFMILLMILPTIVTADASLVLNDKETSYTDFQVDYFIEKDGQFLDIDDIQKVDFNQSISNKISLGYSNNEIWFRIKIHNDTSSEKKMVLEFTEIFHEVVDLYTVSNKIIHKKNGLQVTLKQREIQEANPSFFLDFTAQESKDIYIKISSSHGIFGAIEIKSEKVFNQDVQIKKYIYLAYLVAITTIILYNLIYFFYFKDRIYLYYITYVLLFATWIAIFKGVLLNFIDFHIYSILQLVLPMLFIAFILFSQAILQTEKKYLMLHKVFNIVIYMSIIAIVWMVISPNNGFYFMNILSIPLLLLTLIMSIWLLNKQSIISKIYILALAIYIIGIIIIGTLSLGYLPYSKLLSNVLVFVSIIEIVLFSLLLAYRINLVRKESIESREQLLEQQQTESTRLFHTVGEKTKELNRAKKELEEELRKKIELEKHLQHLASTDPMTELYNRRAFFDISDLEVSGAKSDEEHLACLVIDIDHFKRINDTYGHDVGDKVITAVSKLMVLNTRTKDHIGRIGGEEFAVLMPKTNSEAAYQIADRLRENISKHAIAVDGHEAIKITVSIGLSTLINDKDETIHTLLKRADTALYKAKNNGRNQVCCLPEEAQKEF